MLHQSNPDQSSIRRCPFQLGICSQGLWKHSRSHPILQNGPQVEAKLPGCILQLGTLSTGKKFDEPRLNTIGNQIPTSEIRTR